MDTSYSERPPVGLEDLTRLAAVLVTVDRSGQRFDAGQYRGLVEQIKSVLKATPAGAALEAVLEAFPAIAVLYENLNYEHAGLCRSPLELSLASERQAVGAIAKAMKRRTVELPDPSS